MSPKTQRPSAALTDFLAELVEAALSRGRDIANKADLVGLVEETRRQEFAARMAEANARVAQELAIARRIEDACEVHMEEFFEASQDGQLGAEADQSIRAGLSASGRNVSRRVFRFVGWRDQKPPG